MSTKANDNVAEVTKEEIKFKEPKMYVAVMYNDDTTHFGFVISVLMEIFKKSEEEAISLTNKIHTSKHAVVAKSTKEYLETLAQQAMQAARYYGFNDFTVVVEPEE